MEPKSLNVGPDYAEGLISKMRTLIRKNPPQGDKLPGTAQPASFAHRLQQTLRGGFHREPSQQDSSSGGGATALVAHRSLFFFIAVALMAALAVSLSLWLSGVLLVQAQDSTTIDYTENSEDAVVTLSAGDPEDATPITWSLVMADPDGTGPLVAGDFQDHNLFKISQSGVLEFKNPPDYDEPGDVGDNNIYNVVVQVSDGDAGNNTVAGGSDTGVNMVDDDDTRRWFKVIVNVQDINEPGSIRMHYTEHAESTLLQPQIGVPITAAGLMDEDGDPTEPTYQWQRSSSPNGPWEDISGETDPTYTPQQAVTGADFGKHLRVVAIYTEAGEGGRGGQRAMATSMYPTILTIGDNNPPSFTEGAATTRPVRENRRNTNIGARVAATNPESGAPHNEKLTYWLSEADQGAVTTALTSITETLTPAPEASDTETTDAEVGRLFSIDPATGQLKTKGPLDYEDNPYYAVTVNVADSSDDNPPNAATITVIIRVLQTNDEPEIEGASTIEHVEGETALDTDLSTAATDVAAYDATDDDPTDTTLEFSLDGGDKDLFKLRDSTTAEDSDNPLDPAEATRQVLEFKEKPDYEKPMDANEDNVYEVTIKVFDGEATTTKDVTVKVTNRQENGKVVVTPVQARIGVELTATLTDSDIVTYGPMWRWESSGEPGEPCTDKDAEENDWTRIPGANSDTFTPRSSDLNSCLRAVATYNDGYHEYVRVPEPTSMPSASGLYEDADTKFDKTANKALSSVQYPSDPNITPEFSSAMTKRFVLENGAVNNPVGRPVTARDGNGPDDALTYTLSGDTDAFSIHPTTGQLMTKMKFDHESEEMYTVTVTATDTHETSDSIRVDIYVVDVDEMPVGDTPPVEGIGYTENSEDAVVTLSAGDPEDATPITWSLVMADPDGTGPLVAGDFQDHNLFKISQSGVLEFKNPPDYDEPGDVGDNNIYNVVVQVSDGDAGNNTVAGGSDTGVNMVDDDDTRRWFKVIVNVQDINEPGSIRMHYTEHAESTLLQPQIGVPITAAGLMDEDGDPTEPTYQWQRSSSPNGPWEDISGETDPTYTPQQAVTGADLGKHLRVVATYTEAGEGGLGGQDAMATSMYPTIQTIGDNNPPSFTEGAATTRPVRENGRNTNIGARVAATNPESGAPHNEKLTYWLSEADQGAVTTALTSITETLTPAPEASDTETTDAEVGRLFSIDPATGQLKTKGPLDYEDNPYYAVTVNVADSSDDNPPNAATITVIIRVLQTNDEPEIEGASTIEHVEGETALDTDLSTAATDVAAYDATDDDPTDTTLEFSLDGGDKDLFKLRDSTTAEDSDNPLDPAEATRQVLEFKEKPDYEKPMDANEDNVYEVTIKVFDGEATTTKDVTVKVTNRQENGKVVVTPVQARIGVELTATLTDSDIVTYGPMWRWESSGEPGEPCTDKDAEENDWTRIPGANSDTFTPRSSDLNSCLRAVATYNDGYHEYVRVPEPTSMPSASGLYEDADTKFDKTANKALSSVQYPSDPNITPEFSSAMTKRFVLENGAVNNPVGRPVTARDGNGPDDALTYTLSGDTDAFSIHPTTGQLMTKMKFDHESEEMYTVTVTATDTHETSDSIRVDIYVVDVDEKTRTAAVGAPLTGAPSIEGPATVTYREGRTADVGAYSVRGETPSWALSGTDRTAFRISGGGVVTFVRTPDYETKTSYTFTVEATVDGNTGTRDVTVNVTNVDEDGMVRLSPPQPVVGSAVTATLTDEDGGVTGESWRWARADTADGTYSTISGATSASYTPVDADGGKYLRATVRYRDAEGSNKSEMAVTANPVQMLAAGPYDADNSGTIDSTEVLRAVVDYFADRITPAQVLEVVRRYFADN